MQKNIILLVLFALHKILYSQVIIYPTSSSSSEKLAAKELKRYIFLRTGTAPSLTTSDNYIGLPLEDVIVVGVNSSNIITELKEEYGNVDAPNSDNRKGYLIKSFSKGGRNILVITGADTTATLYAAYRFAELIGCHFNLAGDVIPDQKLIYPLDISSYNEKSQPWFELRGNLPFHNFLAGPDFWSVSEYKSFITQQSKMGMNFFGLHHYPERGEPESLEGPEPHVWIGHKSDVNVDGTIKEESAYTSYWASTYRTEENSWSGSPVQTTDFSDGSNKLFPFDEMASDAIGFTPAVTAAEKAAVFNNVGFLLNNAFTHAKHFGVKTAIGTESPLAFEPGNPTLLASGDPEHLITHDWIRTCPPFVENRMTKTYGYTIPNSRGATNETFAKALYEGIFTRIMRAHPLDYFWIWTYELWSYGGHNPSYDQKEAVADDYRYAQEVMTDMNTPFELATFGWKVGSSGGDGEELEFHDDLPINVPFGTLWDDAEGMWAVLATGRPGWSSCWYEEDWGLIQPQLRNMHIWNEVASGLQDGGVQALIAKHWRINSVAPMSAGHAKLAWDNRVLVSEDMPTIADGENKYPIFDIWDSNTANQPNEFVDWITNHYQDWAEANFGPEKSIEIGNLLAMADRLGEPKFTGEGIQGSIPKSSRFLPSALNELEDTDPISTSDPVFLNAIHIYTEFCSYKDDIVGIGNQDRYMYWYHFFQGQIELCKMAIYKHLYIENEENNIVMTTMKDSLLSCWSRLMTHEMQRVRNISELGIITQLHQSTLIDAIKIDLEINDPLNTSYLGDNSVRAMPEITQIYSNEDFKQKVVFLGNGSVSNPKMYYREIGSSESFMSIPLNSINNSIHVMQANLPNPGFDFEYYIKGTIDEQTVAYPVTGGSGVDNINKTVVVLGQSITTSQNNPNIYDSNQIIVYPNPSLGKFKVDLGKRHESVYITITNIFGQIIQTREYDNIRFLEPIIEGANGVYLLTIVSDKKRHSVRIVKK